MVRYLDSLVHRQCTRITVDMFDPPVVLWFLYDGPVARVELSAPFDLIVDGRADHLDPERDAAGLAPVLQLIGKRITHAAVHESEGLRLEFDGHARLSVVGDPARETWWFDSDDDRDPGDIPRTLRER